MTPPARLRLRVTAVAEKIIRGGHPWVFADSVREQNRAGETGEFAVLYDREDRFLAIGLYDAESPLRVRILHAGKPQTIDAAWWRKRLQTALDRRTGLFDAQTTGYRCIYGESDGWPGLVLDRYGDALVLKLYTAAWLPRLASNVLPATRRQFHFHSAEISLTSLIGQAFGPSLEGICRQDAGSTLILRLSRNIQVVAAREFGVTDGQALAGAPPQGSVVFLESGLRFEADVVRGQKTGFFLDQRENRRLVESLAAGRAVLNAFSFSGGFSLYAARGGAKSVTDLDISPHALESARRNFALNRHLPAVAVCPHEQVQADCFEWLAQKPLRLFDLIVLDPPSLAKREVERERAIGAYHQANTDAIRWLAPGGILLAASCSAHVSPEEFFGAVREAAHDSGRAFTEMQTLGHPPDHAATFPEAQYLKAIHLRF